MSKLIHQLEKVHSSIRDVTYILFEEKSSPYLVVSFAAYFPAKASYSYLTAFDGIPCNRLYILDNFGFERKGAWYLCENLNFNVEYAVIDLIQSIQRDLGIRNENVIAIGSSKGGWCALYYALKYGFGHVIAGAPQILLGSYLSENPRYNGILSAMLGSVDASNIRLLDDLLIDQIVPNPRIKVFLHYSLGDWHFDKQFRTFVEYAEKRIDNVYLDIRFYSGHDQLMIFFPKFLNDTVGSIVSGKAADIMRDKKPYAAIVDELYTVLCAVTLTMAKGDDQISVELPLAFDNTQFAVHLLDKRGALIRRASFQEQTSFDFTGISPNKVKAIRVFFKNSLGEVKIREKQIEILARSDRSSSTGKT